MGNQRKDAENNRANSSLLKHDMFQLAKFSDRPVQRTRVCHADLGNRGSRNQRRPARRQPERRRPQPNRVAKRRERRICSCSECLKKPVCRKAIAAVCVYVTNKRIGTDTLLDNAAAMLNAKESIQGSNHSVGSHTPASRHQSVSSYHSFDSSEHPPMV